MHMKIKPLSDRVIIKPLDVEGKTSGGIYIPDNAKEKPQKGKVIAVGPGKKSEQSGKAVKMEVKKGIRFYMENIPVRRSLLIKKNIS